MMRRRTFVVTAGAAAGAWPFVTWAQRPAQLPLVAAMAISPNQTEGATTLALRENLQALGYVDGATMRFTLTLSRDADDLSKTATDLVALSPRVIFANGDHVARAVAAATTTIPIVAQTDDHVAAGLSDSYARPSRNVTGVSRLEGELDVKRLEILHELLPAARRILVLRDPETGHATRMAALARAATQLGLQLDVRDIVAIANIQDAISANKAAGAEAILMSGSPLLAAPSAVIQIASVAVMDRLPFMVPYHRMVVKNGALISYGANSQALEARLAQLIDRILRGAKPADLPIERATHFILAVNLKTAKALGLTIPPSILARADEVIE